VDEFDLFKGNYSYDLFMFLPGLQKYSFCGRVRADNHDIAKEKAMRVIDRLTGSSAVNDFKLVRARDDYDTGRRVDIETIPW